MTPIDPASSGGRRQYDTLAGAQVDPYAGPYSPHSVGSAPPDGMDHEGVADDGGGGGGAASHATLYDRAVAATADGDRTDQYADVAGRPPLSEVAGMQPSTAQAPVATVQDFVDLGVFTEEELIGLQQANLPPEELGALYAEAVAFIQSPEFAQHQASVAAAQPPADVAAAAATQGGAAAASTEPAWNRDWHRKFDAALKEQGLDSRTRMGVIGQLRQMKLGEADLHAAFEHYTTNPAGLAELEAADGQVRSGRRMQDLSMLATAGAAVAFGAGTTALARSRGNLTRALGRVAAGSGDDVAKAAAQRLLDTLRSSGTMTTAMKAEAAAALRGAARSTNMFAHPLRRASLSAGARHLTAAQPLSRGDALRYGLWIKRGEVATDAARGATAASRAAAAGGGAVDDVARAGAGAVDDVARGAGTLSRASKALGPAGLVLGAGLGVWGIRKTMEAEGGFGEESAKMTGNVVGGLAGGVAGAAAGAAIGSVVPVIGTGIGAVVGGIAGGIGLGKVGEGVGGFLKGLFD